MKKLLLLVTLFVVTLSAKAQYSQIGANTILVQAEQYITNSPTNTVGNRVNMLIMKDSTRWENRWQGVTFTKYGAGRNDGLPAGFLWTTTGGALQHSPLSELRVNWNWIVSKPNFFSGNYNDLTNKPTLFSGAYADLTGKPALFSGNYNDLTNKPTIPAAQVNSDWNAVSGLSQILNKPTLFSGSYLDLTNRPTLFSGAYADLTGKPTLFSGAYADLTGKPTLFSGNYSDLVGRPTLATVATSGDYNDLANKPSIPTIAAKVFNNNVTRTLNSNYTISTTRDAMVSYSLSLSVTNPLVAGSSTASAFLEYSTDGGTNWNTVSQATNSSSVALAVTIALTQPNTFVVSGMVPANSLVRLRTTTAGTATVTYTRGQEVLN